MIDANAAQNVPTDRTVLALGPIHEIEAPDVHLMVAFDEAISEIGQDGRLADLNHLVWPVHMSVDVLSLNSEVLAEVERRANGPVPAGVKAFREVGRRERPTEPEVDIHRFVVLGGSRCCHDNYPEDRHQ